MLKCLSFDDGSSFLSAVKLCLWVTKNWCFMPDIWRLGSVIGKKY